MKKLISNALVALTMIPLLSSCGKSSSGANNPATGFGPGNTQDPSARQDQTAPALEEDGSIDGSSIQGSYKAEFTTLNPQVNGTIPGSLTLKREGDGLMTYLRLFAGKPSAWHQQAIHLGRRCPTIADDTNGDGFIDINEAMAVVGKIIIPLDSNMNTQAAGKNFYPLADLSGYYAYEREASFSRLFADLKDADRDPNDMIAKLGADEKFAFAGRVVMVQGVSEDTLLPETVGTTNRRRPFQNLPIVCGVISKDDKIPGTIDTGVIPGPVADVMEGQDQPAPADDDTTTTTGGTVSGTTGTNEDHTGEVGDEGGTEGGSTVGGTTSGGTTTGGSTTGSTTGGSTAGGSTTGSSTHDNDTDHDGGTTGRRHSGGFIGGFIGGSSGGSTGGTSGGSSGGFIGGFIGGSSSGTSN